MNPLARALIEKLQKRTARAGVMGLGYVGLPLAVELGRAGLATTGIDLDARKVDQIVDTRNTIGAAAGPHVFRLGAPRPQETEPAPV